MNFANQYCIMLKTFPNKNSLLLYCTSIIYRISDSFKYLHIYVAGEGKIGERKSYTHATALSFSLFSKACAGIKVPATESSSTVAAFTAMNQRKILDSS